MVENVMNSVENSKLHCNEYVTVKQPCYSTIALHQHLLVSNDDDFHLLKSNHFIMKYTRTQMASISVNNLASQIATVVYFNFWSCPENGFILAEWDQDV